MLKVIKLTDPRDLGKNVVVQGGTFYNDAVLRSFELISGITAIRPDISGIMGAFGAALIARDNYDGETETTMLSIDQINNLKYETSMARCKGCTNSCLLTINRFSGGRQFITGNRCERGIGQKRIRIMYRIYLNTSSKNCSAMNRFHRSWLTVARSVFQES